jgi:hypothetical protein
LVIAAGMTVGTLFTLFITPIVYTYVAADRRPASVRVKSTVTADEAANKSIVPSAKDVPPKQLAAE